MVTTGVGREAPDAAALITAIECNETASIHLKGRSDVFPDGPQLFRQM
jgi:hypothetical protein